MASRPLRSAADKVLQPLPNQPKKLAVASGVGSLVGR